MPGKLLLEVLRERKEIDHVAILRAVLEQLAVLEASGLCHDDVRTWNVLLDEDGVAFLIDYGSISPKAQDCAWPENVFLAFFIFVRELATGIVEHPDPLRTISISPYNLPQPYRAWAASLWKRPMREWSFKLMRDLLDMLSEIDQCEELDSPQDAWTKAIENAIHIQSQAIRHQKQLFIQAEVRATQAETRATQAETRLAGILNSQTWRLTAPLRWAIRQFRVLQSKLR
jgi:O-antigen chain-terminating methyltransferase